ncbi:MAG: aldo/keto reductase, partial [Lachnospiraceae bacterium]|nr:aldo/keto reductase [Lachnospiraceae bacterium]
GMKVQAYSPIAHGQILKHPVIIKMAEKYGVSVPQICIRYTLLLGLITLPKTGNPEHMKSNANVDFVISDEDMETLKTMEKIKDYGEFSRFPVFSGK